MGRAAAAAAAALPIATHLGISLPRRCCQSAVR